HSLVVQYSVAGREGIGAQRAEAWDMLSGRTRTLEDRFDSMSVTSGGVLISCTRLQSPDQVNLNSFIVRRVADGSEITRANIDHYCSSFDNFAVDQSGTTVAYPSTASLVFYDLRSGRPRDSRVGIPELANIVSSAAGAFTDERGNNFALLHNF